MKRFKPATVIIVGCGMVASAAAAFAAPLAGPARNATVNVRSLPLVRTLDERFMSLQVGFSHLTGSETWKSYDELPQGATEKDGLATIREAGAQAPQARTGDPAENLPTGTTRLTWFGESPQFSPDGKRVTFMEKSFGALPSKWGAAATRLGLAMAFSCSKNEGLRHAFRNVSLCLPTKR